MSRLPRAREKNLRTKTDIHTMSGFCHFSSSEHTGYRFGFNGMEKDDEVKTNGNHYAFGDFGLDPRLGRRWNRDPVNRHNFSDYMAFANNPIIFMDPDGETEFYFNGEWIGTDGVDNNVVAKVIDRDVAKNILESTSEGLNYQATYTLAKGEPLKKDNGVILINADLLSQAYLFMLLQTSSDQGKVGEYANNLKGTTTGLYYKTLSHAKYSLGDGMYHPPKGGMISMHGHPTGLDEYKRPIRSSEPSSDDIEHFKKFDLNIIVGMDGSFSREVVTNDYSGDKEYKVLEDLRYNAINFFDKNSNGQGQITAGEAAKMLTTDRGKNGKKFQSKGGKPKNKASQKIPSVRGLQ